MKLIFETYVDKSACEIWAIEKNISRLREVSRPLILLTHLNPQSNEWQEGGVYDFKIDLFGVIPWSKHQVRMTRYCNKNFFFETDEGGGPIKVWRHRHDVVPVDTNRSVCRDQLEIKAGILSPVVWVLAQALYRKRHKALRAIGQA